MWNCFNDIVIVIAKLFHKKQIILLLRLNKGNCFTWNIVDGLCWFLVLKNVSYETLVKMLWLKMALFRNCCMNCLMFLVKQLIYGIWWMKSKMFHMKHYKMSVFQKVALFGGNCVKDYCFIWNNFKTN